MTDLLIRDIPSTLMDGLSRRAARNGRTLEAEHRLILEEAVESEHEAFWREADLLREETRGLNLGDSTAIIRESRESGWSS